MGNPGRAVERRAGLSGRDSECALLDDLLSAVRRSESRSFVLRGEAGIGKTALLDCLVESATDMTVVRAAGVESEMELAFASLHQLCAPLLDRLEMLPAPQRQALEIVFGLSAGTAPDRFLVGLGVLTLFSEVAEQGPLLCVVDDAQWLDQASALTLTFVTRRLLAESVGIVFAARERSEALTDLPALEVRGLRDDDARALLSSAVGTKLDEHVRDRIVTETQGNPLALLELPRGLTATQLAGGFGLVGARAVSGRIEQSFVRRLETRSGDARRLLLLAAADPVGDPLLLWRAAKQLGIAVSAVDAETDGLLVIGERVAFRHPLVRSAVYRSAAVQERRAVHLALAKVTDEDLDPDRRAWHLAAAAAGPDEQVALELELSAGRAQARGGLAAAAAFLERAVALSEDPARCADRATAAAEASVRIGAFDPALRLLDKADAGALDELQRAQIDLVRARLEFASKRLVDAIPLFLAAARRLEAIDISLARETYVDAFFAALTGTRLNDSVELHEVAQAARTAPRPSEGEPTASDLLLDAVVALVEDYKTAIPVCREAVQRQLSAEEVSPEARVRWFQGACVALEIWDHESAYLLSHRHVRTAREMGTLQELTQALNTHTPVLVFSGELSAAATAITETQWIEEATQIRTTPYGALVLAAWRGDSREARALFETTLLMAGPRGEGIGLATSEYARAVLCNGLGEYEEALAAACSASEFREVVAENWGLSELIEPATRTGRTDIATDALNRLAEKARAAGTDWALGIEARSRALLSDGDHAEDLFGAAIGHLSRTRVRAELARTHLLYGEWLRRESRRVDARVQLRAALDQFASMGMDAFAERARRELRASGAKARKRTAETRDDLTAHERQIAQLARDGLSNPEIGSRLFLSPRTVEYHLSKVFGKLGIRSRRELANALPSSDSELVHV